ncbi:MAG TPA: hypothetical protein VNZ94_00350 [Xanthobacteraceae bacterium]|nr:hypothetical protein [Xanthobacteraceae bacterium]
MSTEYTWWRNALKGVFGPINADEPMTGFYRGKRRNKQTGEVTFQPVAYWYKDGVLHCRVDGQPVEDLRAREIWPYVSRNPVTDKIYFAVVNEGQQWPDLNDAVIGHNSAPVDDDIDAIRDRIEDLAREAERMIKAGAAGSEDSANQASDLANTFGELQTKIVNLHKVEKQPHLEAGRAVDTKWFVLRDRADDLKKRLKSIVVTPFLRKKDDEARAAQIAAIQTGKPVEEVPQTRVVAGSSKRSTGLRTYQTAKIVDRDKLLESLRDHPELNALLQSIADKAAKSKIALPGCEIVEEKRAA